MADWFSVEILPRVHCAGSFRTSANRRNSWTPDGRWTLTFGPAVVVVAVAGASRQCPPEGCSGLIFGNDSDGDVDCDLVLFGCCLFCFIFGTKKLLLLMWCDFRLGSVGF